MRFKFREFKLEMHQMEQTQRMMLVVEVEVEVGAHACRRAIIGAADGSVVAAAATGWRTTWPWRHPNAARQARARANDARRASVPRIALAAQTRRHWHRQARAAPPESATPVCRPLIISDLLLGGPSACTVPRRDS